MDMAFLPIEKNSDNKILRAVSAEVKKIEPRKMSKFLDDMRDTMFDSEGVGLAAPQVSRNVRVVICRFNHETSHEIVVEMINPVISDVSDEMDIAEEGCLSIPGKFDKVWRHRSLTVKYFDRKGRENVLKLRGWNARIAQHEVDHLNGMLYIDRVKEQQSS